MSEYAVVIAPLSDEDGGGFMGVVPDLLGCMSDGETPVEALTNAYAAIEEWLDEARRRGMDVPAPGSAMKRQAEKMKSLRTTAAKIADVEDRLSNIEDGIRELNEQAEHMDSWARFASLTGMSGSLDRDEKPALPC